MDEVVAREVFGVRVTLVLCEGSEQRTNDKDRCQVCGWCPFIITNGLVPSHPRNQYETIEDDDDAN